VIKIGTRALISINGKLMLATHWDGYPLSLGRDLLECNKSLESIIQVADSHTIDAANDSIRNELNKKRIRELSEKHHLTEDEIREGKRRGNIITPEDHEISDIGHYGDWAEYQYDIRGEVVLFRPLFGEFPELREHAPAFKRLTPEMVTDDSEG